MPCYNMEDYIDEGLESIYNQTYQDFSVIIADDASPSKNTVKKLSQINRARCSIYYEKNNLGLTKISNKYMSKLNSEYVLLFSPDDKMHPDFLREQVEYLNANQNVAAVCTWIQEFGDSKQVIEYHQDTCKLPEMLVSNNYSGAALMRKKSWLAAGKYDTSKEIYPNLDYELWLSMLDKDFTLGVIPKPLFYWRVVSNSLSHSMGAEQLLVFRKALSKKYSHLYKQHSEYVTDRYLEIICDFENYYAVSMEGHDWLDQQYKNLTALNSELIAEAQEVSQKLEKSIQKPYIRFLVRKMILRRKRN